MVPDEKIWQKYIYEMISNIKTLEECYFNCIIKKFDDICEIFVFDNGNCYFGRSTFLAGNLNDSVPDADFYVVNHAFEILKSNKGGWVDTQIVSKYFENEFNDYESKDECALLGRFQNLQISMFVPETKICYTGNLTAGNAKLENLNFAEGTYWTLFELNLLEDFFNEKFRSINGGKYKNHISFQIPDGVQISDEVHSGMCCFFNATCEFHIYDEVNPNSYHGYFGIENPLSTSLNRNLLSWVNISKIF